MDGKLLKAVILKQVLIIGKSVEHLAAFCGGVAVHLWTGHQL